MKKLIFLLILALATVGFVLAVESAQPPDVFITEAVMSGSGADNYAVTPGTVLEKVSHNAEQSRLNVVYNDSVAHLSGKLSDYEMQRLVVANVDTMLTRQCLFNDFKSSGKPDYPLRQ